MTDTNFVYAMKKSVTPLTKSGIFMEIIGVFSLVHTLKCYTSISPSQGDTRSYKKFLNVLFPPASPHPSGITGRGIILYLLPSISRSIGIKCAMPKRKHYLVLASNLTIFSLITCI